MVRNVMAHHQGMTVVAIANTLLNGCMRERFHSDPLIMASELLLQERTPRHVAIDHPRAEEVKASASETRRKAQIVEALAGAIWAGPPVTHLLSNGHYSVMLTATGGGYSRWGDIAVTRWHEDATRDDSGSVRFPQGHAQRSRLVAAGAYSADTATQHQDVHFRRRPRRIHPPRTVR